MCSATGDLRPTDCSGMRDEGDHQEETHGEEEKITGGPKFYPPVYIQRYALVQKIMAKHNVASLVDFGSAECKIVRYMKNISALRHVFLVDIDEEVLRSNLSIVKPDNLEYLLVYRRLTPLTVSVLHGSAGELDSRIVGCQAASLVEIIEHLEPETLKQVTQCVFGRLRPSLVVVTTPNADFNVLFPDFTGFRHWDHKFEWTREEFQTWCEDVCTKYGYSASYTGVGDPPPEMTRLGFCSQAAIFTKVCGKPGEQTDKEVYNLVQEIVYPHDSRTPAQRLANEVDATIHSLCRERRLSLEDPIQAVISTADITMSVLAKKKYNFGEPDVREYLQKQYTLSADGESIVVQIGQDSSDSSDSCADSDHEDRDGDNHFQEQSFYMDEEIWG